MAQKLRWMEISDPQVLKAMATVPRHQFVDAKFAPQAYADKALPIGEGEDISSPHDVAFTTQALQLKSTDHVLEIGTGSGYQAAVMGEIAVEVYTIDIVEAFAKRAQDLFQKLGIQNIFARAGDGYLGWPDKAPFDKILLTTSPTKIPLPLVEQLKEGGLLLVPLGGSKRFQQMNLYMKKGETLIKLRQLSSVQFSPMKGKVQEGD